MSQLQCLVTQMHGNEAVININHSTDVQTMERWVEDADPQNICGYFCFDLVSTYYIFATYVSAHGITLMRQKWLDELGEV